MLNIGGLKEGVVIDHIKAGGAMEIYNYLGLENLDCSVAIIKNAKSNKMGKKDIIKVECPVDMLDLDILGFIDHNITVNIIKNGEIAFQLTYPTASKKYYSAAAKGMMASLKKNKSLTLND